jgi:hypothetical protein
VKRLHVQVAKITFWTLLPALAALAGAGGGCASVKPSGELGQPTSGPGGMAIDAGFAPAVQNAFYVQADPDWDLSVQIVPPPPPPPASVRPGYTPGESFTFALSVDGIEGGSATIDVSGPLRADAIPPLIADAGVAGVTQVAPIPQVATWGPGSQVSVNPVGVAPATPAPDTPVAVVHAVGQTSPLVSVGYLLRDTIVSYLPLPGATTPLLSMSDDLEHGKTRHVGVQRNGAAADFDVNDNGRLIRVTKSLPSDDVLDGLGTLAGLRGWPIEVGDHLSFLMMDEVWLWRVDVDVEGTEHVAVAAGGCEAFHFKGTATRADDLGRPFRDPHFTRPVEFWMSTDATRIPLKVVAGTRWGDVVGELSSYTPAPGAVSPLSPPSQGEGGTWLPF